MGPCGGEVGRRNKKALRLVAVNIIAKQPYLDGVEPEEKNAVIYAVNLLEAIRGADRLKLEGFSVKQLTAQEFHLVSYLAAQVDGMGTKGKAGRG